MRRSTNGRGLTEIAQEILRYFVSHPAAADTLEGIAMWWLERERVERSVDDVAKSLHLLESRGLIVKRQGRGVPPAYRVHPAKRAEIEQFLENPGGSLGRRRPFHRHPCFRGRS